MLNCQEAAGTPVLDGEWRWAPCGEITVGNIGEPHGQLLDAVQAKCSLLVDLSACTYMDACALQLLVAAQRAARLAGLGFRCTQASAEVRQDARELGLGFILDAGQVGPNEGETTHG